MFEIRILKFITVIQSFHFSDQKQKMAEHGAALQTYNNELVKCIEDLNQRRDEVSKEIKLDENEKEKLEHDIAILHERLQKVNTSLARKIQVRDEYGTAFK